MLCTWRGFRSGGFGEAEGGEQAEPTVNGVRLPQLYQVNSIYQSVLFMIYVIFKAILFLRLLLMDWC